jgi:hypothetical protein
MTEAAADPFGLARDLASLRAYAEHGTMFGRGDQASEACVEISKALLALLDALAEGHSAVSAIREARRALTESIREHREFDASLAAFQRANHERREREEAITQRIACPFCGAAAGSACRTVGPNRAVRSDSHRDRYRLARSINDTTPKADRE